VCAERTPPLVLETAQGGQPLSSGVDQPLPAARRCLHVHRAAAPSVGQSGEQISIKALGGGSRAPRRRLLGTRLVWKQKSMTSGVSSHQPYQKRPGCRRQCPNCPQLSQTVPNCNCTFNLESARCKIAHGFVASSSCRCDSPADACVAKHHAGSSLSAHQINFSNIKVSSVMAAVTLRSPHPRHLKQRSWSPRNTSLVRNGMKRVSQRRYEIKPCIIRNLVNIGHAWPPGKLQRECTAVALHGRRILQMILWKAMLHILHISSIPSFLSSCFLLSSTRRRLHFSAANSHSLLLPNWLGCLHSFFVDFSLSHLFRSLYSYFCCIPSQLDLPERNILHCSSGLLSTTSILTTCWIYKSDITIHFYTDDFYSSRSMTVMSTPTNQMNTSSHVAQSNYIPVDAINRHDFGVQKNRKQASTGGGRAWSEDEVWICSQYFDYWLTRDCRNFTFSKLASRRCPINILPLT
jgi:hypothetical protein